MTTEELHGKLLDAYSARNLNRITVTLIQLYKEQQFGSLRQIAEMISETIDMEVDGQAKYFPRLMMLYHPDRDFHRNEINRLAKEKNHDGLLAYSHILLLGRIEEIAAALTSFEDIDYAPVYEWDFNLEGFTVVDVRNPKNQDTRSATRTRKVHYNFYDAIKIRMFGKTTISFPPHYLEDMEEIELSGSGINDLEGVNYCIHTTTMDLSGNSISDLTPLWDCTLLEELNLSDNRIEDIDMLANLRNLRTLYLSNNAIKDITPLLQMGRLEYVDLSGTRVPVARIRELEEQGITVAS
jgi:hypothetical protein